MGLSDSKKLMIWKVLCVDKKYFLVYNVFNHLTLYQFRVVNSIPDAAKGAKWLPNPINTQS